MKTVELTKGYVALVDDDDFAAVSKHSWAVSLAEGRGPYATARIDGRQQYMHRWLLAAPTGVQVDHENLNGLDNQRDNLRLATGSQNQHNKSAYKNNTSGFKGVSRCSWTGRWVARTAIDGRRVNLGRFDTAEEANTAVTAARSALHGEFARHL